MCRLQAFNTREFGAIKRIEESGSMQSWELDGVVTDDYSNLSETSIAPYKADSFRHPLKSIGCIQQARFSPETDVYGLIGSSKLLAARQFNGWVYGEVVASILTHARHATDELLQNDAFFEQGNTQLRHAQALAVTEPKPSDYKLDLHIVAPLTTPGGLKEYWLLPAIDREQYLHKRQGKWWKPPRLWTVFRETTVKCMRTLPGAKFRSRFNAQNTNTTLGPYPGPVFRGSGKEPGDHPPFLLLCCQSVSNSTGVARVSPTVHGRHQSR